MAGAGGSLRAGVTENPVRLTRSVRQALTTVTAGGAPVYVWPGGGITFMVDVTLLPRNSFGYVPTPALVAPIEFTLRLDDYAALGGHVDEVRPLREVVAQQRDAADTTCSSTAPWSARFRSPREAGGARSPARDMRAAAGSSTPRRRAPAFPRRPDRSHHRGLRRSSARSRRPMRRPGGGSRPFSTNSAPNCRCCARPRRRPRRGREGVVARRMAAAVAPFHAAALRHADGGGRRRGRRGDSGGDDRGGAARRAPMSTTAATSRCISTPGETFAIGMVERPDRPSLFGRADDRGRATPCAASRPRAGAAAASRSASPTR